MELDMVADMKVDKVADIEVDMVADIEVDVLADINIDIKIQFGEIVGRGGLLNWAKTSFTRSLPGLRIF